MPWRFGHIQLGQLLTIGVMLLVITGSSVVEAAPPARQPALVVYLSSIDGVLDDVDYVLGTGGQPELSQMVKGFVTNLNDLKGIDRSRPIGIMAYLPVDLQQAARDPEVIGFLPVNDIEELKNTFHLSNLVSLEPTDQPDRYEIKTTEKTFYVRVDQGHAFISEKSLLLDAPLASPGSLTEILGTQYDLVAQVRRDGVPKLLWDLAMVGILSASDKELKTLRKSTAAEDALKVRGIEMGRTAVVSFMTDVRSVWFGVRVSRQDRNAVIDAKLEFDSTGKVMRTLKSMAEAPSRFAAMSENDAPASLQLRIALPEEVRKLTSEAAQTAIEKKDPAASIPEPQRTSVNSLIDVIQKTVDAGDYELLVQLTGEAQTGMTLVTGIQVADGQTLSTAMTKLLPEVKNSEDVKDVVLDAGEARGIHFSRIEGKDDDHSSDSESRDQGKVDLFYGGKPSLYIGTDAKTLWLIVGDGDALDDFASLEEGSSRAARTDGGCASNHFGSACLHLSDWLGLLSTARDQKTQEFTEAARVAVKYPERDALRISVYPVDDGLQLTVTFDEAYLNLLGAAVGKE